MRYPELRYDGTWAGFLCALAYAFSRSETTAAVVREGRVCGQGSLAFGEAPDSIGIESNEKIALEFMDELSGIDPALPKELRILFAAEPSLETRILAYLLDVRARGRAARFDYSNPNTRELRVAHRRVEREINRMTGLLRFEESTSGLLVAKMEPDNDILMELVPHFFERMGNEDFLIIDMRRGKAWAKKGGAMRCLEAEDPGAGIGASGFRDALEGAEIRETGDTDTVSLWRKYYAAIEIEGRRNPRLRRQFMPVRYWKYLPEMEHSIDR